MTIIVIEGPDGIGKTTVAKLVVEKLKNYHLKTEYIHFPNYEYYTGDFINKCLHGELVDFTTVNPYAQHMMYALDRYCWFEKNKEKYKDHILIFDRYVTSSQIYQLSADFLQTNNSNISKEWLDLYTEKFSSYITHIEYNLLNIPAPYMTLWLDIDENLLKERINNRVKNEKESKDNFEVDRFADIVYKVGQYVSSKYNWKCIDASGSPDEIANDIVSKIANIIKITIKNIEPRVP